MIGMRPAITSLSDAAAPMTCTKLILAWGALIFFSGGGAPGRGLELFARLPALRAGREAKPGSVVRTARRQGPRARKVRRRRVRQQGVR
jgi:hypothetical protein